MRDPRVDPKPGDVLRRGTLMMEVGEVFYSHGAWRVKWFGSWEGSRFARCHTTFRSSWGAGNESAEVIHAAA